MAPPRPLVLVHGAWHGAWCWASLQAELDRRGVASTAIDLPGHGSSILPLGGLHDDAAHLATTLDHLDLDDAVLVGHSYGGAVITEAAAGRTDLAQLVYIAAFALDDTESVNGALRSFERREVALAGAVQMSDNDCTILDAGAAAGALYGSCPPEVVAAALQRLSPQPLATMTEAVTGPPRTSLPSTYVRCLQDQAVHPDHQAVMAARCTEQVDIDTDHSPFISAVTEVADLLERIARS
jgi:pimeloyl-ACP methyl ester carboxylesterase